MTEINTTSRFQGRVLLGPGSVSGYVYNLRDLSARWVVELWVCDAPVAMARALHFESELAAQGISDGCYGFGFPISDPALVGQVAEVRLTNMNFALAPPFRIPSAQSQPTKEPAGRIKWRGGLHLEGWLPSNEQGAALAKAWVDGVCVASASADRLIHTNEPTQSEARGFSLWLPTSFADGDAHIVEATDAGGVPLEGSPLVILAYPDGLRAFLSAQGKPQTEDLRAAMVERMIPQSLPFAMFEPWRRRFPLSPIGGASEPLLLALIGSDPTPTLQSSSGRRRPALSA